MTALGGEGGTKRGAEGRVLGVVGEVSVCVVVSCEVLIDCTTALLLVFVGLRQL